MIPESTQGVQAWDRYGYANNSPVRFNDPTGHWIESLLDVVSIVYDVYDISQNGLNWGSGLSLAADVAGLILPGITGGGAVIRALTHADDVVDAARAVNTATNIAQAGNQIDNVADGTMTYRAVSDNWSFNWKPTSADISNTPPGLSCSVGCEGMGYEDIFKTSVGRDAHVGDHLYQVDTNTMQNSPFGLTLAPTNTNPYHA
jgi:hypothetical protein